MYMKKLVIFCTLVLSTFAMAQAYTAPEELRIGLFYNTSALSNAQVMCAGGARVLTSGGNVAFESNRAVSADVKKGSDSNIDITIDGKTYSVSGQAVIETLGGTITISGKEYRGRLEFSRTSGGSITVINIVDVDNYVKGVVAAEMPSYYGMEALKAQAVCARNYGVTHTNKHKTYGFDLCTGIDCQVYGGVAKETARTNQAVDETSGMLAFYDDKLAELYFFATSGGHTESNEYVWGGSHISYLTGVPDEYEPESSTYYRWTYEISPEKATDILSKHGLGDVEDIQIISTSPFGAVTELKVIGTQGTKSFKLESARTLFGGGLQSQVYTLKRSSGGAPQGDAFISALGVISDTGKKALKQPILSKGSGNFIFTGRGWGHLLGMSQNGAGGMAEAGFTYEEILKHYYQGVTISR